VRGTTYPKVVVVLTYNNRKMLRKLSQCGGDRRSRHRCRHWCIGKKFEE